MYINRERQRHKNCELNKAPTFNFIPQLRARNVCTSLLQLVSQVSCETLIYDVISRALLMFKIEKLEFYCF